MIIVVPNIISTTVIALEEVSLIVVAGGEQGPSGADGSGYIDTEVAIDTQMVVSKSYRANDANQIVFTLPLDADSEEGDSIRVLGVGMGGWKVAQNALDIIKIAGYTNSTTVGVTGFLESAYPNDCVELFKIGAHTWLAILQGGSFA